MTSQRKFWTACSASSALASRSSQKNSSRHCGDSLVMCTAGDKSGVIAQQVDATSTLRSNEYI